MNIKSVNRFFGYVYFAVGAAKGIILLFLAINLFSGLNSGYNNTDIATYGLLGIIIGFVQLALGASSILMILINISKQPNVILGYVLGILAFLIESLTSGIVLFFLMVPECYLYMEAGKKITKACATKDSIFKY